MPRRNDIDKIAIIGSGPIVIGQACEFDYSAPRGQGLGGGRYEVILVNSNPATIMTDPGSPFDVRRAARARDRGSILERERPDALLPTLGGQTALNLALELDADGTLKSSASS